MIIILGLSDVIVDIVETGTTLYENGLEPITDIMRISARLISNQTSYRFKNNEIIALKNAVSKVIASKE